MAANHHWTYVEVHPTWWINALKQTLHLDYTLTNYIEHSLDASSKAEAAAYVSIKIKDNEYWGVGIHEDIICASIYALISAINNSITKK